jgi:hypothetical protein
MQPRPMHENIASKNTEVESQKTEQASGHLSPSSQLGPPLYQNTFFSRDPTITAARKLYLKMLVGGILASTIVIFGIFPILYGAFYKTPMRNLDGWIVVSTCRYANKRFYLISLVRTLTVGLSGQQSSADYPHQIHFPQ